MDIPALIVFLAFGASAIVLVGPGSRAARRLSLGRKSALLALIWLLLTLGGEFLFGWAGNSTCSPYLGCVEGFAGYDAFEHLFFGVAGAFALLWISFRFPRLFPRPEVRWQSAIVIVSLIALVGVLWEFGEFLHDVIELDVFHLHLIDWRLHINQLDQPTNSDTVGDLVFSLGGAIAGSFLALWRHNESQDS